MGLFLVKTNGYFSRPKLPGKGPCHPDNRHNRIKKPPEIPSSSVVCHGPFPGSGR
jgi:hypothetical protein